MGELTDRDLDVIIEAAHPSRPDRRELTRGHVERILAARAAQGSDLAAKVAALAWRVAHDEVCDLGRYCSAHQPIEGRPGFASWLALLADPADTGDGSGT